MHTFNLLKDVCRNLNLSDGKKAYTYYLPTPCGVASAPVAWFFVLVENYASRAVMSENQRDLRINIGAEGPQKLLDMIAILTRIGSSVTVSNGDLAVR